MFGMKAIASLLIGVIMAMQVSSAQAADLLMFEEDWCNWCERWNVEIGVVYNKTTEGKRAPLRRIDIHGAYPDDIELVSRPQFTPTFVLVDNGVEIGRIEGYPGEDFFWGLLSVLLEKLPSHSKLPTDES